MTSGFWGPNSHAPYGWDLVLTQLVPAFGRSWKRYLHPSLASWLWLMPAGLSQPHATGHVRELPGTTHAAGDPLSPGWAPQWDEEQGLSEPAQSSPLDINHKFHLHPSCSCSANSLSPVVHRSFCKGGWCPFPSSCGRTSLLQQFRASQFALEVCALSGYKAG